MSLFRYAVGELRGRLSRTVPTLLASVLAVSSFVVLTGTVERQRLEVTQLVNTNYRGAYDVLVRPKGSTSAMEAADGLVRQNYLSGIYGGITLDQVGQIRKVTGVQVAAPIAMVGVTWRLQQIVIDAKKALAGRQRVLLRYVTNDQARNGTAKAQSWTGYIYLSRGRVIEDGSVERIGKASERVAGKTVQVCVEPDPVADQPGAGLNDPAARWYPICRSVGDLTSRSITLSLRYPLLIAAVDPDAENALVELGSATVKGRSLDTASAADAKGTEDATIVPAVMATDFPADYQSSVRVVYLSDALIDPVFTAKTNTARRNLVMAAASAGEFATVSGDAATQYREGAGKTSAEGAATQIITSLLQPGDVQYQQAGGMLQPVVQNNPVGVWLNDADNGTFWTRPVTVADTSYRHLELKPRRGVQTKFVALNVLGEFDPSTVGASQGSSGLLGAYSPQPLTAADDASLAALGDKPMRSDLNPAGYLQDPPSILISLDSLPKFDATYKGLNATEPISAVRIRVAGVTGVDPVSRERIRVAAEQIQQATGLDVDITLGTSITDRTVSLPATDLGSPALQLKEAWIKKGVAVTISDALDTKSLALFILVLISAALTVAIAATASVRARHSELAILSCLGWRPGRLRTLVLTEALVLGLVAGVVGAGVAVPIGQALGLPVDPAKLWFAIPIACVLNLAGASAAAVDAGRSRLVASMNDVSVLARALQLKARGPVGVGITMLLQRPRRLALGAVAVAVGTAAVAVVVEVNWIFAGTVVGSVLGDAVAIQTQASDVVAVTLLAILALVSVAVVLFTGATEDAQALAALRAVGWRDRSVAVLITSQGAIIGLIGSAIGLLIAVTTMALTFGANPFALLLPAAGIMAVAILAACGAALPVARRQATRSLAASLMG
ncbi:MAG: ABC transporter permease [Propionibacteriaceae bacterium]|nr:ABC transporter permease [Propionibacteriaceae bacterium]